MKNFRTTHPETGLGWLNTRQAAAHCSCSEKTIERAVRGHRLKFKRLMFSSRYRFRREWLDAWINGEPPDTGTGTPSAERARNSESGPGRF